MIVIASFLSFDEWKRESFPDGGAVGVYRGTDGWNIIGIHRPGDAAVLGIDVTNGHELRLDRTENCHRR